MGNAQANADRGNETRESLICPTCGFRSHEFNPGDASEAAAAVAELEDHDLEKCGAPPPDADLYTVLGVKSSATADAIKRAYYRLSLQLHPDRTALRKHLADDGPIKSGELMMRINEAYEVLSDPAARKNYDTDRKLALKVVHEVFYAPYRTCRAHLLRDHKVDPRELIVGDHVYFYMSGPMVFYHHHGIVSFVGGVREEDDEPEVMVIDFGVNYHRHNKLENDIRPVRYVRGCARAQASELTAEYF
mmetsp:Transcript_84366/g.239712  ORF Transcript_84366/g.239712 Transcript_84366/m.239712 type:complete len:247 (-) Transcript_84366:423-1163(-)